MRKHLLSVMLGCFAIALLSPEPLVYAVFPAPPYMIVEGESGQEIFSGIDIEILSEAARRANVEIRFLAAPWIRCLEFVRTGEADLISSVFKTSEREVFLTYFRQPYLTELPISFYYLSSDPVQIAVYEDLENIPFIGVLRGASYFSRFDTDSGLSKFEVKAQDMLYPLLFARRITVFAGYVPTEKYFIKKNGYEGKILQSSFVYSEASPVYFAASRKTRQMPAIEKLDAQCYDMLKDGTIKTIINKYYDTIK